MQMLQKHKQLACKLIASLPLILLANCAATPSTSINEQARVVQAQTAVAEAKPTLEAAAPVAPPPSSEICTVFKPLRYHASLAIKGSAYYDLATQADYDNRILLSFCPQLDPRNK